MAMLFDLTAEKSGFFQKEKTEQRVEVYYQSRKHRWIFIELFDGSFHHYCIHSVSNEMRCLNILN